MNNKFTNRASTNPYRFRLTYIDGPNAGESCLIDLMPDESEGVTAEGTKLEASALHNIISQYAKSVVMDNKDSVATFSFEDYGNVLTIAVKEKN